MNRIKSVTHSLRNEIKKKIYNKHSATLEGIPLNESGIGRVEDQYKDYLYYYQQATRWR